MAGVAVDRVEDELFTGDQRKTVDELRALLRILGVAGVVRAVVRVVRAGERALGHAGQERIGHGFHVFVHINGGDPHHDGFGFNVALIETNQRAEMELDWVAARRNPTRRGPAHRIRLCVA